MLEEAFKTGRLLLPTEPSAPLEAADAAFPWLGVGMAILFVLLLLLLLRNFLHILPYLSDSVFRARGSTALDSSVRVSRDRNIIALIQILPLLLVVYRPFSGICRRAVGWGPSEGPSEDFCCCAFC